tara:strand:+ start:6358 stop:7500 length:1143 start_codon:yes stop_codon:yes gene_type:complete
MSDILINDYKKFILKPINQSNNTDTCWINSPLYLISSHPYIFFQFMLLDDSVNDSSLIKHNDDIYNLIIYIYKYIQSEKNQKSRNIFDKNIYIKLFNILKVNNYVQLPNILEVPWDATLILEKLISIFTKNYTHVPEGGNSETYSYDHINRYLSSGPVRFVTNKHAFYNIIKSDTYNAEGPKNDRLLIGFVLSQSCLSKNQSNELPIDVKHWQAFLRKDLNTNEKIDNIKWYMFCALEKKILEKFTSQIYDCLSDNTAKFIFCMYFDIVKFKKIILKNNNKKYLMDFISIIKHENNLSKEYDYIAELNDLKKKIKLDKGSLYFGNNFKPKNKETNHDIANVNLLTIKELEKIYRKNIEKDKNYYTKNIYDKREYIMNLIN